MMCILRPDFSNKIDQGQSDLIQRRDTATSSIFMAAPGMLGTSGPFSMITFATALFTARGPYGPILAQA